MTDAEEAPEVEEIVSDEEEEKVQEGDNDHKGKLNKNEKKARKVMAKLGLKSLTGVNRVVIKKSREIMFVIKDPEVMKSPSSDTYIIFGEAKIEDLTHQAASQAAKQFSSLASQAEKKTVASSDKPSGSTDDSGLSASDIELVMAQANVTREQAIAGLKKNDGDIVNTIMELTVA